MKLTFEDFNFQMLEELQVTPDRRKVSFYARCAKLKGG